MKEDGSLLKLATGSLAAILILTGFTACTTTQKEPIKPSGAKLSQMQTKTNAGSAWRSVEDPPPEPKEGLGVSKVRLRTKRGERLAEF